MIKHSQTNRNNNLQYNMQKCIKGQELKGTPYIIKFACAADGISDFLPETGDKKIIICYKHVIGGH